MFTRVDERLRREAVEFGLRFSCRHCVYFDEPARACSEGYPVSEHLRGDFDRPALTFCKLFEEGG